MERMPIASSVSLCFFSTCITCLRFGQVYSWKDCQFLFRRIQQNEDLKPEDKERQATEVQEVIQFSLNECECRRVQILTHFSEPFDPSECNRTCDNCANPEPFEDQDMTSSAINLINIMKDAEQRNLKKITRNSIIDTFRGRAKEARMTSLRLFGVGKDMEPTRVERIYDHLVSLRVFEQTLESNASNFASQYAKVSLYCRALCYIHKPANCLLQLGTKCDEFVRSGQKLIMKFRVSSAKTTAKRTKSTTAQTSKAATARKRRKGPHSDLPDDPIEEDSMPLYGDDEGDGDFAPEAEVATVSRGKERAAASWPPVRSTRARETETQQSSTSATMDTQVTAASSSSEPAQGLYDQLLAFREEVLVA